VAEIQLPDWDALALNTAFIGELRSDHAGETGAVFIYRGILAVSRQERVVAFAREHLAVEERHLAALDQWLPSSQRSRLLPLWRLSGWILGATAGLAGEAAVYHSIEAVETFVVRHYQQQIGRLGESGAEGELRRTLCSFRDDEAGHRDDAGGRVGPRRGGVVRIWQAVVGGGSAAAVRLARLV